METIQLRIKKAGKKEIFEAIKDGVVIASCSSTTRVYVALLLMPTANGYYVCNRFGRYDLIGQGDSKFPYESGKGIIARLDFKCV